MTTYRAYGRVIASDHPLPELEAVATSAAPDWTLTWSGRLSNASTARWTTLWRFSTGEPWVATSFVNGVRHLRFGRYLDCAVSERRIEIARRGRATDRTLRHLILDQALPLALASSGSVVVHASAVADGPSTILLAGRAGAGKSTLAALLARAGRPVLADDGVLLERRRSGVRAVPSYPGLRVYRDSAAIAGLDTGGSSVAEYTRKLRIVPAALPADREEPPALGPIYVLAPGTTPVSLEELSRRDAAVELLAHTYRADLVNRAALEAQLDGIVNLAPRVWRLAYPRDLTRAADVAAAVAVHARALSLEPDAARD